MEEEGKLSFEKPAPVEYEPGEKPKILQAPPLMMPMVFGPAGDQSSSLDIMMAQDAPRINHSNKGDMLYAESSIERGGLPPQMLLQNNKQMQMAFEEEKAVNAGEYNYIQPPAMFEYKSSEDKPGKVSFGGKRGSMTGKKGGPAPVVFGQEGAP